MKNGVPGAQDEKRPRDCCDVDDGMLIPWLKTDREMDTWAPGMVSGSLEKRPIYSCRAHIATSFVLAAIVIGREAFRGDCEILGGRGIRLRTRERQVSGLIILHRIRVSFFGQGLYGGSYRGV
jgi:hypothetical protein